MPAPQRPKLRSRNYYLKASRSASGDDASSCPLYQLRTAQSRKIVIDNKYVIVVVARKFFERAITIGAKLDNPFLTDEHLAHEVGNLFIVLDVQN